MKNHTVTLRLSDSEYKNLKYNISCTKMTISQYIRALISNINPRQDNHRQEAVTQICKLYICLTEKGLDEDDSLMQEMKKLCQIYY